MSKQDYIICILGASGSGKTTICNKLKEEYGYSFVNSYTTRPRRTEDEVGHTFRTVEEFKILKDMLCAYTIYQGNEYGATESQIENSDLYVIDYEGLKYFKEKYKGNKKIHSIFICIPDHLNGLRMLKRGDTQTEIELRLNTDEEVFNGVSSKCDTVFINDDLDKTVADIDFYIRNVWRGKFEN